VEKNNGCKPVSAEEEVSFLNVPRKEKDLSTQQGTRPAHGFAAMIRGVFSFCGKNSFSWSRRKKRNQSIRFSKGQQKNEELTN